MFEGLNARVRDSRFPGQVSPALGPFVEILVPEGLSQLDRIKAALCEALRESLFQDPETLGEGFRIGPE